MAHSKCEATCPKLCFLPVVDSCQRRTSQTMYTVGLDQACVLLSYFVTCCFVCRSNIRREALRWFEHTATSCRAKNGFRPHIHQQTTDSFDVLNCKPVKIYHWFVDKRCMCQSSFHPSLSYKFGLSGAEHQGRLD